MNLYIDTLSGIEFENYLLNIFKSLGYEGETTLASNDYGADLVVAKDGIKTVIQAKRYSDKVGIYAVQEVVGAKNYYNADKCLVITNSYFTPNAINLAEVNNVELWDRNKLINMVMLSLNPNDSEKENNINQNNNDSGSGSGKVNNNNLNANNSLLDERDELLTSAITLICSYNEVSTSLLQRKFRIGFNRASKLLDQLEQINIVSAKDENYNRKILINNTYSSNKLEKDDEFDYVHKFNTSNIENDIHKNKHYFFKILLAIILFVILSFIAILNINNAIVGTLSLIFILCFSYPLSSKIINTMLKEN